MSGKRLVFLANSFHLGKTRSTQFLIDLLEQHFEVSVVPHKRAWLEVSGRRFDILVSFQHIYKPHELEAFGVPRIVLVPMFDDSPKNPEFWKKYSQFSVLSFSKTLTEVLAEAAVPTCTVQYYPPIQGGHAISTGATKGLHAFFWQRTPSVTWEKTIKPLLGSVRPDSFHFHAASDPDFALMQPTQKDIEEYRMSITNWFENPEGMAQVLRTCNVYFAPRVYEGIGMSFLEALALGHCVVAPNRPTMNEYITHGVDGILYNSDEPLSLEKLLTPESIAALGAAACDRVLVGRIGWETQREQIVSFLIDINISKTTHRKFLGCGLRIYAHLLNIARNVRRLLLAHLTR